MDNVKSGDNVLVIWNNDNQTSISSLVEDIKAVIKNGSVVLENSEMITESSRLHSSYEAVLSNWLPPHTVKHTDSILAIIVKLLKPNGKLILKDETDLTSMLKLNGFINVTKSSDNLYIAEKPKFEVGSKASLKLNGQPAVWKLEDTVEEAWTGANDDDIIDDNQLLDENDLKKPDQQSLRVCATTGKRKACADCSCGLAEELKGETKETPKSSCGSIKLNRKKASGIQLAYITKYMKNHPEMATGQISTSLQKRAHLERQWLVLANKLNSLGGPIKTVPKWKQAWRDVRNKMKKKAAHIWIELQDYSPDDNDPLISKPLSETDEQVVSVVDPVAVYGMEERNITEPTEDMVYSPRPSLSQTRSLPVLPVLPVNMKTNPAQIPIPSQTRKRRRISTRLDNFDTKILQIKEERLKIERERNAIMERKNCIALDKNTALNRLVDVLQELSDKLKK